MNKLAALLKEVGARNSKGGQDTELAHVNPAESRLLKLLGGSGRIDPVTGLKHYDDGDSGDGSDSGDDSGYSSGDDGDSGWGGDSSENSFDDGSMASSMGQGPDGSWGGSQENSFDDGSMANSMGQGPDGSWGSAQENSFDNGSMAASMGQNADGTWGGGVENDAPGRGTGGEDAAPGDVDGGKSTGDAEFGDPNSGAPGVGLAGEYGASGFSSGTDTAGAAEGGYATLDDDGTGKGRSGTAFGPGGELEGFGQWSQEFGNSLGSHGWDTAKTQDWLTGLVGYDPSKTGISDVVGGLGFGRNAEQEARNARESEAARTGALVGPDEEAYVGPGTRGTTTQAARDEYNAMGWRGELTDSPWGYVDTEGKENTNWGSIGHDITGVVSHPATAAIATALGFGLPYAAINAALQAGKGNYQPGVTTLASILGGPQVAAGVGALSNLVSGTPGNTIAGLGSGYLNSISPGLGSVLNATGITGMGARGINEAFQTALNEARNAEVDGDLSTEGTSFFSNGGDDNYASAPSDMTTSQVMAPEPVYAAATYADAPEQFSPAASFSGPTYTPFGGGGSDGGEVGNEFLGSKKKTRYMQNQLMALLGGRDAA